MFDGSPSHWDLEPSTRLGRRACTHLWASRWLAGIRRIWKLVAHIALAMLGLPISGASQIRDRWPGVRAFFVGTEQHVGSPGVRVFVGYGGLLTAITPFGSDSHRVYLVAVAPVMALRLARGAYFALSSAQLARAVLTAICICQAVISVNLLSYIHQHPVIEAEYGPTASSTGKSALAQRRRAD